MRRIRYIVDNWCRPDVPINQYPLFSRLHPEYTEVIRLFLPDDMLLEKDDWWVWQTRDKRTLRELSAVVIIKYNGKWTINERLTHSWLDEELLPSHFWNTMLEWGYRSELPQGYYRPK